MKKLGILLLVISIVILIFNLFLVSSMFGRFQNGGNHQGIDLFSTSIWAISKLVPSLIFIWMGWTLYKSKRWVPTVMSGKYLPFVYWLGVAWALISIFPSVFMMVIGGFWFAGAP